MTSASDTGSAPATTKLAVAAGRTAVISKPRSMAAVLTLDSTLALSESCAAIFWDESAETPANEGVRDARGGFDSNALRNRANPGDRQDQYVPRGSHQRIGYHASR